MFLPASQPKGSSEDLLFARPCPLCSVMGVDSPRSRIATYGWWRMRSSVGSLPFRRARHRAPRSSRTAGIVSSTIVRRPDRSDSTDHFDPRPALQLQESPGFGFTPPSVPSLRMPGERSLAFASPCAPRVRRWETIPGRLADHAETRRHRNCRLWIQYLR